MSLPESSTEAAPVPAAEALPSEVPPDDSHERWRFFRDVCVFQVKLVLGNIHNFVFVPVSLAAAAADVLFKHQRHGSRFYKVMEWARDAEHRIGVYSALDEDGAPRSYSVDAVIARIEDVMVREYAKGGTAASVKAAVDRAFDKIQTESPATPEDILKRAAEKLREKAKRRGSAPP